MTLLEIMEAFEVATGCNFVIHPCGMVEVEGLEFKPALLLPKGGLN